MIGRLTGGPHADYAVVIIMAVFVFASLSWVLSARKWFKGPVRTVDEDVPAAQLEYSEKKARPEGASQVTEEEVPAASP